MLEGLTKYWGFYLVAVWDVNGVGIQDLHDALVEVNVYESTSIPFPHPTG